MQRSTSSISYTGNYSLINLNLNNKDILKGSNRLYTLLVTLIYLTEIALICLFFVILSVITVHVVTNI
jgi:hypothetical protein